MVAERFDPVLAVARSWWVVVLCTLLGVAVLAGALSQATPRWTSSTTLLVSGTDPSSALLGSTSGGGDMARLLATQARVVLSDAVVEQVATGEGLSPRAVREAVEVEVDQSSDVLEVVASGDSAEQAQQLAAEVTAAYLARELETGTQPLLAQAEAIEGTIQQLQDQLAGLQALDGADLDPRATALAGQIAGLQEQQARLRSAAELYSGQVSVLTAAQLPGQPSSLSPLTGAALGAVLGFALGLVLALARGWYVPPGVGRRGRQQTPSEEPDGPAEERAGQRAGQRVEQ